MAEAKIIKKVNTEENPGGPLEEIILRNEKI